MRRWEKDGRGQTTCLRSVTVTPALHTMIVRCLARRPAAVQSIAPASRERRSLAAGCRRLLSPAPARSLYTVPSLAHHGALEQRGVPGLLSPRGFQTAYTDYQQHIVDELNESTAGTAQRPPGAAAETDRVR